MVWRIGVDIGGTFTDVAIVEEKSGRIDVAKVPTTPLDLAEGVQRALASAMSRYDVIPEQVSLLSHATTVVTNAILQDKGARAALITTRGFRDVLELRRSARAKLYDLFQDAPATLIPRRRRFEISERIGADGDIVTPLADRDVDELIAALKMTRVDSIAVSLLFSFLNPVPVFRRTALDKPQTRTWTYLIPFGGCPPHLRFGRLPERNRQLRMVGKDPLIRESTLGMGVRPVACRRIHETDK